LGSFFGRDKDTTNGPPDGKGDRWCMEGTGFRRVDGIR
jgi:hypothetical protein